MVCATVLGRSGRSCATGASAANRRRTAAPPDLARAFYDVEAHSMLELEPPRHTRLRGLVLRAFTSRRIVGDGTGDCGSLPDASGQIPGEFRRHRAYAQPLPVIVIARLLGVPETLADQLLAWSNAMVAMYQARRTPAIEAAAVTAATEFADFLRG